MSNWQLALFFSVMIQRLLELLIARSNAKWIKKQGGYEVGKDHYPLFILLHSLFFLGIWLEADSLPHWWIFPFILFITAQLFRIWVIISLGRFWNTRILVLPKRIAPIQGPYRYLRHPNYLVVIIEFLTFPLIYQAYATLIITSLLNAYLLYHIRIPIEEKALQETTPYNMMMKEKNRLLPFWRQSK